MKTNTKLYEVDHDDGVRCVKIADELLITCGGRIIKVWKSKNGKLLKKILLSDYCYNVHLNPDRTLLAVAYQKGVLIWNFSNYTLIKEIQIGPVYDAKFNDLGTKVIFGEYDGELYKVDLY